MPQIPRRQSRCLIGGEPFLPGGEYHSVLDAEGNRHDYCSNCWSKATKPEEGHFWRGSIPAKKEKMITPDARALDLFRTVEDLKLKFVLALYLQRKEQLIRRTSSLYEVPETGEVFDIPFIALTQREGEELAQTLDHLLCTPT